jgi:ABC-type spermidine/putrescine transport system permease subunit II
VADIAVGSVPETRRPTSWLHRLADWAPALPIITVLCVMLVLPIVALLARSFMPADGLGLSAWSRVLDQPINRRAIATSLELALVCAATSVIVGTPLAWLISRMVASHRAAWIGLLNVSAHFGGIGLAFAYVATLGSFGMVTLLLRGLGATFDPPARDSFLALVITYEHANIPLYVLLIVPAMAMLRDEWAEAAAASAATRLQFWRRIGLPILAPFIAAGFVLSFTWSIGIFGIAYALAGQSAALPIQLITLQIGQSLADDAIRGPERAAVLSVILMLLAALALVAYRALLARGARWLRGGPGLAGGAAASRAAFAGQPRRRTTRFVSVALFGALAIYLCLPIVAVALYSIAARWTTGVLPEAYTLDHWSSAFASGRIIGAFTTSLTLAAWTTAIVLVLTVPAVYWMRVRNGRIRPVLELAAAIPFALPFVVIGFAVLSFTAVVAPGLQGSYWLLVLAYVAISFPFVYWTIDGAMAAADVTRLSEAAATCGASAGRTLWSVVLPNIRAGITTAAMLAFALAIGEFALVKVLASSIQTVPVWSASAMTASGGSLAPLAVVTVVTFGLLFLVSAAVAYLNRGRSSSTALPGVGGG